MFKALHAFFDTNALVKVVYAITLYHRLNKLRPKILDILEDNILTIY